MPSPNQLIGCYPEHDRSEERRLGPRHILAIGDRKGTKFQARPARQRILQTRPAARGPWPRLRNCRLCFPRAWALFRAAPQPCRSAHVCARMGCRRLAEVIISRTVRQYRPAAAGAADPPRGAESLGNCFNPRPPAPQGRRSPDALSFRPRHRRVRSQDPALYRMRSWGRIIGRHRCPRGLGRGRRPIGAANRMGEERIARGNCA